MVQKSATETKPGGWAAMRATAAAQAAAKRPRKTCKTPATTPAAEQAAGLAFAFGRCVFLDLDVTKLFSTIEEKHHFSR